MAITMENMTGVIVCLSDSWKELTLRASIQHVEEVSVRAKAVAAPCWHKEEGLWLLTVETLPHHPSTNPGGASYSAVPRYLGECYSQPLNNSHYLEIIILIKREIRKALN